MCINTCWETVKKTVRPVSVMDWQNKVEEDQMKKRVFFLNINRKKMFN